MKKACAFITLVPSLLHGTASFGSESGYNPHNPFASQDSGYNSSSTMPTFDPEKAANHERDAHIAQRVEADRTKKSFKERFSLQETQEQIQQRIYQRDTKDKKNNKVRNQFGEKYRFELANGIAACSSKMLEKHYAGIASFLKGAGFIRDMQFILQARSYQNDHDQLESLHKRCTAALAEYKKDKKDAKIDREKIFDEEQKQKLDEALQLLFPNNHEVVIMMQKAYSSLLDCKTPTGLTVGGAAVIGGYGGMYRQICHSPLGRRIEIMRLHGGPALGILGVGDTSAFGNFSKPATTSQHSHPFRVTLHQHAAAAGGLGVAEDVVVPVGAIAKVVQNKEKAAQNSSQASAMISPSVGLGIYLGAGLNFEYRKELPGDFSGLYDALGLLPQGLY